MIVDTSKTEEEVLNHIRNSDYYKSPHFRRDLIELEGKISRLVSSAKIYILDNYKKVDDWFGLYIDLYHNKSEGKPVRFGPKERDKGSGKNRIISETLERLMKELNEENIEIETIENCVYDWSDGDFSLDINGVQYLWIDGGSVIEIAQYIMENIEAN